MNGYFSQLMQHYGIRTAQASEPRDERRSAQGPWDQKPSPMPFEEPITALFETEQEEAFWSEAPKASEDPVLTVETPSPVAPSSVRGDAAPELGERLVPAGSTTSAAAPPSVLGDTAPAQPSVEQNPVQQASFALATAVKANPNEPVRELVPPQASGPGWLGQATPILEETVNLATGAHEPLGTVRTEPLGTVGIEPGGNPLPTDDHARLATPVMKQPVNQVPSQPTPQLAESQIFLPETVAQLPQNLGEAVNEAYATQKAALLKRGADENPAPAYEGPLPTAAPSSDRAYTAPAQSPLSTEGASRPDRLPMSDPNPPSPATERNPVQQPSLTHPAADKAHTREHVQELIRDVVPPRPTAEPDLLRQATPLPDERRAEVATVPPSAPTQETVRAKQPDTPPLSVRLDQAALEASVFQQVLNWVSSQPTPPVAEQKSPVPEPVAQRTPPRDVGGVVKADNPPQSAAVLQRDPHPGPAFAPAAPLRLEIGSIQITVASPSPPPAPVSAAQPRPTAYQSPFGSHQRFRRFYF